MKRLLFAFVAGAFALLATQEADAAVVQFGPSDWVNQEGDPINITSTTTLTDDGFGNVLVELAISGLSSVTGDIFKIGFEGLSFTSINSASANTGDSVSVLCNNCDGQPNGFQGGLFNSAPYDTFDTIVQIGMMGSSSGLNSMISFVAEGVSALDAIAVGLRIQTVSGVDGTTSLRLINETPSEVPLPAAGFLLLGGLGALALMRRRKTA